MARMLAIVEGHTEDAFIKQSHPNAVVFRGIPNGGTGTVRDLDKIAEYINDKLRVASNAFDTVLIMFDKESIKLKQCEVVEYVYALIDEANKNRFNICFAVPDTMIENWILADEAATLSELCDLNHYKYAGDGTHGKNIYNQHFGSNNDSYTSKAKKLKRRSANAIALKSPSFMALKNSFTSYWWWIDS